MNRALVASPKAARRGRTCRVEPHTKCKPDDNATRRTKSMQSTRSLTRSEEAACRERYPRSWRYNAEKADAPIAGKAVQGD
jgi:hypothetical protein